MSDDTRHNVNESADKYRASTDVTRGTGTRDQEKIKLNARGDDPTEAVEDLGEMVDGLPETAQKIREIQPEEIPDEAVRATVDAFDVLYDAADEAGIDPESWDLTVVGIDGEGDITVAVSGADDDE